MRDHDEIAARAARQAVCELFGILGVDINKPDERRKLLADFAYLRKSREGSEDVMRILKRAAIMVAVSGALWAFWEGLKVALRAKGL